MIKAYNDYQKKKENQLSEEEKLFEYLQAMKDNGNRIIPTNSSLLFGDGTQMRQYWKRTKNKIYKMITEEENQFIVQYKEQCEVLIKDYNNYQEKLEIKITEEGKILEYLQAMKENGNKIIPYNSSLLFSNGTQMAQYWNNQKNKMYKMITAEGNQFVAQYKEQCEVLINEYIEFQERKKKKQEKYKESESDFREESSFDKVLADEIGKGPNEDGKVL